MSYKLTKPHVPTFTQKGLTGFQFLLQNKELEIYFIEVTKGHDNFIISKEITHMYYILEGEGFFTIEDEKLDISQGMLVEVPPGIEYCFSGRMTLLLIMNPPWFADNEQITKKNSNVIC